MLSDWYTAITGTEAYKLIGYMHGPYHKYQLLMQQAPAFMAEVKAVMEEAMQQDNFKPVSDYNILYTGKIRSVRYEPPANACLIIDLEYEHFSMQGFVSQVLPVLLEHPLIAASYRYFYMSPVKYYRKYQHKVSICFSLREGAVKYYTLAALVRSTLKSTEGVKDLTSTFLFDEHPQNGIGLIIEGLRKGICHSLATYICKEGNWDPRVLMTTGLSLLEDLRKATGIEKNDLFKVISCLMQNWIFGNPKPIRTTNLAVLREKYGEAIKMAENFYQMQWASYLPSLLQNGLFNLPPGLDKLGDLAASSARELLEQLAQDSGRETGWRETDLSYQACKALHFDHVDAAYCYITLAEEIFTFLNLSYQQRFIALHAFFKASEMDKLLQRDIHHLA
jgi:hypothetical protein